MFRVAARGGRFVLRVHHGLAAPDRVRAHVRAEFAWLEHTLRTTELVVPRPIRLANGECCGALEVDGGERVFVLFEWIEGERIGETPEPEVARRMGRALAVLHASARDLRPARELCPLRWDDTAYFGPRSWLARREGAAELGSGAYDVLAPAAERVRGVMDALGEDPRYFGLIHSDAHAGNMLLCGGDVAILDFNDCGFGPFAFDLGGMLQELSIHAAEHAPLAAAVAGYEQVAPLPLQRPAQLQAFLALRCLCSLGWMLERGRARGSPWAGRFLDQLTSFVSTGVVHPV